MHRKSERDRAFGKIYDELENSAEIVERLGDDFVATKKSKHNHLNC